MRDCHCNFKIRSANFKKVSVTSSVSVPSEGREGTSLRSEEEYLALYFRNLNKKSSPPCSCRNALEEPLSKSR
jgi:hypothetical protein